jgi:hypothetical protein
MLDQNDIEQVIDYLCGTAEAMGVTLSPNTALIMAADLSIYPLHVIEAALQACRKEVRGRLTMADILQRVLAADGRPGKDEAWSIALASSDEYDTTVMTDEIQLALSAARPVLSRGDKVGARMAFISAYDRLVQAARTEARPVNWHVSIGFDANRRIEAINGAVQMQRISLDHGQKYLADLNVVPIAQDGLAIVGLLTGKVAVPSPSIRQNLKAISDGLKVKARQKESMRAHQARLVRKDLNDRINRQMTLAAQHQQELS